MNRNDLSAEEHVTIMIGVRKKAHAAVLLKNSKKLSRKGSIMKPNWTGLYHIKGLYTPSEKRACN